MKSLNLPADCTSQLCKHLSPEIFDQLKDKKTAYGYTFIQAINSGIKNIDSGIGVYAGDNESYRMFAPLFDPIIEDYHGISLKNNHKTNLNAKDLKAPNPDIDDKYILSTRIRVGRNLADFPLGPACTKDQRDQIESTIIKSLSNLTGEFSGQYHPLLGMPFETQNKLISDHFLFKEGDRFLEAAGLNRDWPRGRGIYHNDDKTFLIWVNEEDQLRIISMQMGGDIETVFKRLLTGVKQLETTLNFLYDERLGYISSCPTNLGTAMRASVHIALPNLSNDMAKLKQITDQYHLQIRGIDGEHTKSKKGIFDISNRRRLGITEVEAVQDMYDGVKALIKEEEN